MCMKYGNISLNIVSLECITECVSTNRDGVVLFNSLAKEHFRIPPTPTPL